MIKNEVAEIMRRSVSCAEVYKRLSQGAKTVQSDMLSVMEMLRDSVPVYASRAPSFAAAFGENSGGALVRALKALGFAGVSETAVGAQMVTWNICALSRGQMKNII